MSDPSTTLPPDASPVIHSPEPNNLRTPPSRKRVYWIVALCVAAIFIALPVALYIWGNSASAQEMARKRLIEVLEQSTGARVEIGSLHWRLLTLEIDAQGIVLHGKEESSEAPFTQIDDLAADLSVAGVWSPRILLSDLTVTRPKVHIIVYSDGSTNAPQPAKPRKASKPALDAIFDLQAAHAAIREAEIHSEDRAADFDSQNRFILFDCEASGLSALARYIPASGKTPEAYRIEAGATDLRVFRGKEAPALGSMQATLELTRNQATLRSLRLTSKLPVAGGHRTEDHALEVTGQLRNFAHPSWTAHTTGELDLRLLEPALGYPFAPVGIAHLNLESAGEGGEFRTDGSIHLDGGAYVGTGVNAPGLKLDAHVHADPRQLLITKVVVRLHDGGQLSGEVLLSNWLPPNPNAPVMERANARGVRATGAPPPRRVISPRPNPDQIDIPVDGKVRAEFKDVSLDALLDMVSLPPFQRLGFNTLLQGQTNAIWTKGDVKTLAVDANLNLALPSQSVAGEVPASGVVDATYTHHDGAVDVRKLLLHTLSSQIEADGHLGAYPLTSPSGLSVRLDSHDLREFDPLLKDLGLVRDGKSGTAALPIALGGQGQFHGNWTGSLLDPHLAGTANATDIAIEMLPPSSGSSSEPLQQIHWDSADATGSYTAQHIAIQHGTLRRGDAEIDADGTLDAAPPQSNAASSEFNSSSLLHLNVRAKNVDAADLLPFAGQQFAAKKPIAGTISAQLQTKGQLSAPDSSGWVELDNGSLFGEPVKQVRAEGTMSGKVLKLSSASITAPAGTISGSGSYTFGANNFNIDARGNSIDIAKVTALRVGATKSSGTLTFSLRGAGTLDDPRLDARGTLNDLNFGGESLGALVFAGHTLHRTANYNATTTLEGAKVDLNGETSLELGYQTHAKLAFSNFDIGGLLKSANVRGLTGQSALGGSIELSGPLANPTAMHGEAQVQEMQATIAGVHLASKGGVHAVLVEGRVQLDPVHITGEDTDLHTQGIVTLKAPQRIDFAAAGSVNLKLAQSLDPDLTANGSSTFRIEAHGPFANPGLRGRVEFENGSLSLGDIPNGLSQLHGTLEFNQNRLEVRSLTAMSGGGQLSVGGYLAYQRGLYADLSVIGKGIRIRYPTGVSSLADTTLHMQGAQSNLLLSGDVMVTRFAVNSDLDISALAAQSNSTPSIASPDAPSNHIHLDVHIASSPQLNFQNAYAKLAGNVDLRLRGTLASPSLLGRVSITEGSAIIAGTRYDLQRGDVFFTNPVRVEPSIDLNATARVEDYDITLGLHGTPQKMSVTYRSDPPLPEADVVALLALGRTENQQRLYTQQQEQYVANPTTDALLGGALNATVSSRVQRLFGAGSVKVDPNYIGTLGNSTSRITVEEQLGRNLTLTYATNVDTTAQQLLQAEIAINRHVSLLVARDESGVFSMVVKATRRYR